MDLIKIVHAASLKLESATFHFHDRRTTGSSVRKFVWKLAKKGPKDLFCAGSHARQNGGTEGGAGGHHCALLYLRNEKVGGARRKCVRSYFEFHTPHTPMQ
jgi:hypothetical protein